MLAGAGWHVDKQSLDSDRAAGKSHRSEVICCRRVWVWGIHTRERGVFFGRSACTPRAIPGALLSSESWEHHCGRFAGRRAAKNEPLQVCFGAPLRPLTGEGFTKTKFLQVPVGVQPKISFAGVLWSTAAAVYKGGVRPFTKAGCECVLEHRYGSLPWRCAAQNESLQGVRSIAAAVCQGGGAANKRASAGVLWSTVASVPGRGIGQNELLQI